MELKEDRYELQGIPVTELAEKYGLPLYVYDTAIIERQYHKLVSAFSVKR